MSKTVFFKVLSVVFVCIYICSCSNEEAKKSALNTFTVNELTVNEAKLINFKVMYIRRGANQKYSLKICSLREFNGAKLVSYGLKLDKSDDVGLISLIVEPRLEEDRPMAYYTFQVNKDLIDNMEVHIDYLEGDDNLIPYIAKVKDFMELKEGVLPDCE